MNQVMKLIQGVEPFNADGLSNTIKPWIGEQGVGFGQVMMPLRLSLVGAMKGPDVFDIAALLGKEETLNRIDKAVQAMA